MKYRLNKLPVKTTNSFKINDLEIELDIPQIKDFKHFKIDGDVSKIKIDVAHKNEEINSRIGLKFDKYLNVDITIPKDVKIKDTIIFNYDFIKEDVLIDKININFEEDSNANFVFIYKSLDASKSFHHVFLSSNLATSSQGSITLLNLLNKNSFNFVSLENTIYKNGDVSFNVIDLGGKVKLSNCYTVLYEENSKNYLNHIYIGKNDDVIDINHYLKNIGKFSINKMDVRGVITDKCLKNFRGTIDFVSGCSNALGEENENCILLSDTARSRSLPQMLCAEENVIGTHGVSSGKVDEDKLFYLMSRGYSKKDAEKLIVLAGFSNIINNILDDNIREMIFERLNDTI